MNFRKNRLIRIIFVDFDGQSAEYHWKGFVFSSPGTEILRIFDGMKKRIWKQRRQIFYSGNGSDLSLLYLTKQCCGRKKITGYNCVSQRIRNPEYNILNDFTAPSVFPTPLPPRLQAADLRLQEAYFLFG